MEATLLKPKKLKKVSHSQGTEILPKRTITRDWQHLEINPKSPRWAADPEWLVKIPGVNSAVLINPEFNEDSPLFTGTKTIYKNEDIDDKATKYTYKPPVERAKRQIVNTGNTTEICEVSLGFWRTIFLKDSSIEGVLFGKRITEVTPAKTIYTAIISCNNDNIDGATKLIKKIIDKNKNIKSVNWL